MLSLLERVLGRRPMPRDRWDRSTPVVAIGDLDSLTLGDLMEGTLILGATGSGKTIGSGFQILNSLIRLGLGGLVLTVKPGEHERILRMAREAGREDDVILFDASGEHRYAFLEHEIQNGAQGAGITQNVATLIEEVSEIQDRAKGKLGKTQEAFWGETKGQLIRDLVDIIRISTGTLSVPDMEELLQDLATSTAETRDPVWRAKSALHMAAGVVKGKRLRKGDRRDFRVAFKHLAEDWPRLAEKTRSIIKSSFTATIDLLNRGLLRTLHSTYSTFSPADALQGKIIVHGLPIKQYQSVGLISQTILKTQFQREIEKQHNDTPTFLVCDEFQDLATATDQRFLATARSSKCCFIAMTQNISGIRAAMGGAEQGQAAADSLLGGVATKVWHANGDPVSNLWAADAIGKRLRQLYSSHSTRPTMAMFVQGLEAPTISAGSSEQWEYAVPPHNFTTLRKGGPPTMECEAIVFQAGRVWATSEENFVRTLFKQGY